MAVNIKVETSFRLDISSRAGEGNASCEIPLSGCGIFLRNNVTTHVVSLQSTHLSSYEIAVAFSSLFAFA
jgi:hypothetical protein